MLLEQTINQLDIGTLPPDEARQMGQLGYMQWLGGLGPMADYRREARHALVMAEPFCACSPAVAVFCDLLHASLRVPLEPLPLALPARQRRGGARARRAAL